MSFFKTKKFYILLGVVVLVGGVGYSQYKKAHTPPSYETVKVVRGDLTQTVEPTGKIEAVDDLSLRFELPGIIDSVNVKEGDSVKSGTVLATLRLSELNASIAQAEANLNQRLAGATREDRTYYAAAVAAAKANLDQSKIDSQNTVASAESAVATAKNNLKLAEGGNDSQIVHQAYESAATILQSTLGKLDDALTQADNILGVDNTSANEGFRQHLAALDTSKLNIAVAYFKNTKLACDAARQQIASLSTSSDQSKIDSGITNAEQALSSMSTLLLSVSEVLRATAPVTALPQATLDAKKSTIEATRSSISLQYTAVVNQSQAIANAKNSLISYSIAYDKAVRDLAQAQANAQTAVTLKEAAYEQALANYQGKITTPREVDLAPLRAILSQAIANRNKAIIVAPIDGVVTKVNKKRGEFISSNEATMNLLSPHYEVKVDVSETDVSKLKVGDQAVITVDALGSDVKLSGKILTVDPASTLIQDVVYYKVRLSLDDSDKPIKPGMTANISITTNARKNVLYIPLRTVRTDGDEKKVRVLENSQEKEVVVKLGLKANEGNVEVLEGVAEGQEIIVSKK